MKVVLFCGGYGMRMRNGGDDTIPKPMQMVGPRPLIWHVMRYYAHFGHTEFVLCLGYGAEHIKNYFLTYQEIGVQRLRHPRRQGRAAADRHQRLVDHLRRHRHGIADRRTSAPGHATSSRTTSTSWPTTPTCSPTRR